MTGDVVMLDGDRHESALCEKRGQFQRVCGCGWRSSWTTDEATGREHDDHVAAEKLWARLTKAQREALDVLVTVGWRAAFGAEVVTYAGRSDRWKVNGRAAVSLVDLGMATVREHGVMRFVTATDRGKAIHPLTRCSARYDGKPCGYCHACGRRLPQPESLACPGCGATDWDE